jgi:hypothetical protein
MSPSFSVSGSLDRGFANAINFCYSFASFVRVNGFNFKDLGFRKLRHSMLGAAAGGFIRVNRASPRVHIVDIIGRSSSIEVIRVYTVFYIAVMQHVQTLWNLSKMMLPGDTVSVIPNVPTPNEPVASRSFSPFPEPTSACDPDPSHEDFIQSLVARRWHRIILPQKLCWLQP